MCLEALYYSTSSPIFEGTLAIGNVCLFFSFLFVIETSFARLPFGRMNTEKAHDKSHALSFVFIVGNV